MLEVSARSWHYRLWDSLWPDPPTNLCAYFWGCVLAAIVKIIDPIAIFVGRTRKFWLYVLVGLFVAIVLYLVGMLAYAIYQNLWNALWIPLIAIGAAIGLIALLALVVVAMSYFEDGDEKEKSSGASGKRVTWEFLKARKQKVCPLITVTENDDQPKLTLVE
jgi:hypothetical protein